MTIDDLQPKPFKVRVGELTFESKPLKLSHSLRLMKLADLFSEPNKFSTAQIQQAEDDLNSIIAELIPELEDISLSVGATMQLISGLTDGMETTESKELAEANVTFDNEKKA